MLRPAPEVADMDTQLGPAGRYVDPVFQHNQRHHVGFVRDLVEAGSVGFVEDAVEHVRVFFVVKKAGAQRCLCNQPTSLRRQSGSNFRERLKDAQNWFVGSADIKNAFHQMRTHCLLHAFFCAASCSRIRSWLHRKSGRRKRLAPDS